MLAYIPAPWILWDRVNHQGPGLIATSRTDAIARVFHGQDLENFQKMLRGKIGKSRP